VKAFIIGFLTAVAMAALFAVLLPYTGILRFDAADRPSAIERRLAQVALDRSTARHAPHVTSPLAPNDDVLLRGMRLYRGNCAGCHGGPAKDSAAFGLGFFPPAPQFVISPPRRPEYELFYLVRNGIRRTGMTSWSSIMKDDDIWKVVAFLRRIDSLPASIDSAFHAPPA
jgi:mono/diheme cytochrome c family protein